MSKFTVEVFHALLSLPLTAEFGDSPAAMMYARNWNQDGYATRVFHGDMFVTDIPKIPISIA
jgi:hypothetical protein